MKIYFLELSWLYIVPILVCRLIGLKVYFLDCKSFWLRQKTLPLLSRIGVSWLSHQDLINIRGGLIYKKVFETSENVAKFLFTTKGYKLLLSELNCGVDLRSALISRIFVDYERQIELIAIIESMSGDNKKNPSLICIPNTIVSRFILQRETCLRNIYPIFLTNLGVIFTYISYILKKTRTSLVSRFEKIVCLSYSRSENQVNFKLNYDSVEVCFFPHKGIYYGDLYIKDCFYSANPNSPFFKEKILHIETEGGPPDNSVRFYRENNINIFYGLKFPYLR